MQVSELFGKAKCKRVEVGSMEELAALMTKKRISTGVFKDDYRNNKNFQGTDFMMLDFDDGMTLSEAILRFNKYEYAIATTKSHQKEKNGSIADRFRVALRLDSRIETREDYKATFEAIKEEFPELDAQCSDPARYFDRSPGKPMFNKGATVKVKRWVPEEKKEQPEISVILKGKLAQSTKDFLIFGAVAGTWNDRCNRAAWDLKQNNYSYDEARTLIAQKEGLDDEGERTIRSVFDNDEKYPPRGIEDNPFNFVSIKDLLTTDEKVEWLVGGLLTRGGFSILAGEPKSGKSTIVRQITKSIVTGDDFLGRKVEPGKVLYLALEEQAAMLKEQFQRVGIKEDHPVTVHVGGVSGQNRFDYLKEYCLQAKPDFVIIDTMALFIQVENLNDYTMTNGPLAQVREITREAGSHIMMVHHTNKGENRGAQAISGSGAIHGAVDCAMIFNRYGSQRSITTSQRGGEPFYKRDLAFDAATETYSLKPQEKKERTADEF